MTNLRPASSEAELFAAKLSDAIQEISVYARGEIIPILRVRPEKLPENRHATVYGLFGRVAGWLSTAATLAKHGDGASDFQAYQSTARSLLELTTDLALLLYEPDSFEKIEAWERSARLKHAECCARYADKYPGTLIAGAETAAKFVAENKGPIVAERERYWGEKKHPNRWTNSDLGTDTQRADKHAPGLRLEEFYETQFRMLCWNVHGSTLAGVRGLGPDAIHAICGLSFYLCGHFAVASAELALRIAAWSTETQKKVHDMHHRFVFGYAGVRLRRDEQTGVEYLEPVETPDSGSGSSSATASG